MDKIIYTIFGIILLSPNLLSQTEVFEATINRSNYENFYVVSSINDSILLTKVENKRTLQDGLIFSIVNGTSRKKDSKGVREKDKKYLINSLGDTIITIKEQYRKIEIDDSVFFIGYITPEGWKYTNSAGKVVFSIELFWNDKEWKYKLKYYSLDSDIDNLKRVNLLNLVSMAYKRSKCNCDKGDEDLWLMMYLMSQ